MGFHEELFPVDIAYGSLGGPGFSTEIVVTDSGAEQRIANWSAPRHRFNAAYAVRSYEQLQTVKIFYNARLGPANGFRFKDFFDFTTNLDGKTSPLNTDVDLGNQNAGATILQWQMIKKYQDVGGSPTTIRSFKITKPVAGTTVCIVNGVVQTEGVGFTVDNTTGLLTFTPVVPAGINVKFGCEFDKPVRFGEDVDEMLQANYENFGSGSISDLPLIELVDESPISDEFYYGGASINDPMNASFSITELTGRVHIMNPQAGGFVVFLPNFAILPTGGPWFYFQNLSASETVSIQDSSGTEVGILGTVSGMEIWLGLSDATTKKWYGIT